MSDYIVFVFPWWGHSEGKARVSEREGEKGTSREGHMKMQRHESTREAVKQAMDRRRGGENEESESRRGETEDGDKGRNTGGVKDRR